MCGVSVLRVCVCECVCVCVQEVGGKNDVLCEIENNRVKRL